MNLSHIIIFAALGMFSLTTIAQQNQTSAMSNREVVETFLNGFNDLSQLPASLDLLAEDYHFKNPMVELNSKAAFIGLAKEIGAVLTGVRIISMAEHEDWVAAYYEFSSSLPGVESNIATEWFRLEGGIIQESHLIYDASEWRKIYAEMSDK